MTFQYFWRHSLEYVIQKLTNEKDGMDKKYDTSKYEIKADALSMSFKTWPIKIWFW